MLMQMPAAPRRVLMLALLGALPAGALAMDVEVPAAADAAAVEDAPAAASVPAYGPDNEGLGWSLRGSLERGGDDLVTVTFTDGSSDTLTAGEGYGVAVGGHYRPPGSRVDVSLMVGMKLGEITGANTTVDLTRTTIELAVDYYLPHELWIGAGPMLHRNAELDLGIFGPSVTLDDANGFIYRLGWKCLALAHTDIQYENAVGLELDGSSTSLEFVARF